MSRPRFPAAALLLAAMLLPAVSAADERTLSPYFLVDSDDPQTDRLPLRATSVSIDVAGVIADVTVVQTYENLGSRPIHARYVFPASTHAAVHGLTLTIGDHVIEARTREREQARREFTEARREGKSAALLEQQRPNVFGMNVANILPGDRIDVELRYSELLVPTDGVYELVYPTVVGPRYSELPTAGAAAADAWIRSRYLPEGHAPSSTLELRATLAAGMPIESLTSPSHPIRPAWVDPSRVEVALDPHETHGGDRDFVLRYRLDGGRIQTGLLLHEGEDENFFLLMVQPPRDVTPEQLPPREYVFVVDVSGSMHGFPLDTAKQLLRDLIGDLRVTDTFNVMFFSGGSRLWSPRSMPATPENIADAVHMLEGQRGGGGTRLLSALEHALALPAEGAWSRSLIVVTDGYIGAEKEVFTHVRRNLGDANVFAFGIGSSVNRHLVEGLARAGMGRPFVVLDAGEAAATAAAFRDYVVHPVLTDIGIEFDFLDAYDVQPEAIPDVLATRPVLVQGKWRGRAAGTIALRGASGGGEFRRVFDVAESVPREEHRALRPLWARSRIANLSDFHFAGETEQEKAELIELGLTYNLLTRHTSFIAVHDVVRSVADAELVTQALPLPRGVSAHAVGSLRAGSEPALGWLLGLLVLAGSVAALVRGLRATS